MRDLDGKVFKCYSIKHYTNIMEYIYRMEAVERQCIKERKSE